MIINSYFFTYFYYDTSSLNIYKIINICTGNQRKSNQAGSYWIGIFFIEEDQRRKFRGYSHRGRRRHGQNAGFLELLHCDRHPRHGELNATQAQIE